MRRISRRFLLVSFLFVSCLSPVIGFAQAPKAPAQTAPKAPAKGAPKAKTTAVPLTILHTNDTHSHLMPFSYPAGQIEAGAGFTSLVERTNIGGIARRATLVRQIRNELAAGKTTVWLVDAGDFSDGTPMSLVYHGEADVAAMNEVGYTFGTLGNHEFNIPLVQTRKLIAAARFPLLCANATDNATGKPLLKEFAIENVSGVKVGVFALLTKEAQTYQAAKEGVTIAPEIDSARRMVAVLRPQVDIVVLISHAGEAVDRLLAAQVPGIDVIVGGHSHSRLPMGDLVWHTDDLKVDDVNGTVIVQAHQWGGELGRLDLLFAKDAKGAWHVDRYRERLLPVTSKIADDKKVADVVDRFWQPIAATYGEVVGQAAGDFMSRGEDEAQYNLVTDAIRETLGTDVDLENGGGVRAPLVKGQILKGDLVMMDPFNNTVFTMKLTGRDLKQVLVQTRPYVSGLKYKLEQKNLIEATIGGKPIEDDRVYTVATNSYFAGNPVFKTVKATEVVDTKRPRLDVVADYVRKKGTVTPVFDGRRSVSR